MSTASSTQPAAAVAASQLPSLTTVSASSLPPPASASSRTRVDVRGVVRERELVRRRVPALEVQERVKQVRILAQRARNGAQPSDVLRVTPACVVPAAVRMRRCTRRSSCSSEASRRPLGKQGRGDECEQHPGDPRTVAGRARRRVDRRGGPSASTSDASGASSMDVAPRGARYEWSVRDRGDQTRPPLAVCRCPTRRRPPCANATSSS